MSRRTLVVAGVLGTLAAGLVLVLTRGEEALTPEEQVRAALDRLVGAANAQDVGALLEEVSEGFQGQGMDRDRLRGVLFLEFRRAAWTRVLLTDTQVTMQSDTLADVDTTAVLARGKGVVPSDADRWRFQLTFERDGDAWRLVGASYER